MDPAVRIGMRAPTRSRWTPRRRGAVVDAGEGVPEAPDAGIAPAELEPPTALEPHRDRRWPRGRARPKVTGELAGGAIGLVVLAVAALVLFDKALAGIAARHWPTLLGTGFWTIMALTLPPSWVRSLLRWIRYRGIELRLDPFPGSPGGQVGGILELPAGSLEAIDYQVRLSCVAIDTSGDSTSRKTVWASEGHPEVRRGRQRRPVLAFTFDVPGELPGSRADKGDGHEWEIGVSGKGPGPDLEATFPVPVVVQEVPARAGSVATLSPLDESAPVGRGVSIETRGGRTHIELARGRLVRFGSTVGFLGAVFAGAGGFLAKVALTEFGGGPFGWFMGGVTGLMALTFVAVGGLIGLVGLGSILDRTTLVLSDDAIEFTRAFGRSGRVSPGDIERIEAKIESQMGVGASGTLGYRLTAFPREGKAVVLASNVPGPSATRRISGLLEERTGRSVEFAGRS